MVHKADLVIIGICVGVAFGVLIASLVFFGIRWYKRRVHLQDHANERSVATLPIRTNGLETSVDFSASLSNSVAIKTAGFPATNSQHSWWSHPSKDQFVSASGLPRYSYKYVIYNSKGILISLVGKLPCTFRSFSCYCILNGSSGELFIHSSSSQYLLFSNLREI